MMFYDPKALLFEIFKRNGNIFVIFGDVTQSTLRHRQDFQQTNIKICQTGHMRAGTKRWISKIFGELTRSFVRKALYLYKYFIKSKMGKSTF